MFIRIKPLVLKFSKRPEINRNLQEQEIKKEWQNIIESINKNAKDKSKALYINGRGELVVKVENHLWLQELSFYRKEIEKEINKKLTIKSIRLLV